MAAGDVIILDNVDCSWTSSKSGGTARDISGYLDQAMIRLTYATVETPYTFGINARSIGTSRKFMWEVTFGFVTDGYNVDEIDEIVTSGMYAPLGSGDGTADIVLKAQDTAADADTNPTYSGTILLTEWEPLGGGAVNTLIRQTRTFPGSGNLTKGP